MLTPKVTELTRGCAHPGARGQALRPQPAQRRAHRRGRRLLLEEARHVLRNAEVAQQATRNAGDLATMRLRIGYLPDSLAASVPRVFRNAIPQCAIAPGSCRRSARCRNGASSTCYSRWPPVPGLALLPETVTERFVARGIRVVVLEASEAAFRTAVLTHPDADSLATRTFLSARARTAGDRVVHSPRAAGELAA